MATVYTYSSFNDPAVGANTFPGPVTRLLKVKVNQINSADTTPLFADNDTVKLFPVPPYVKILNARWVGKVANFDSHATPAASIALELYDGSTTKTLIGTSTNLKVKDVEDSMDIGDDDGYGYVTASDDFYVQIHVTEVQAAAAEATAEIWVEVTYTGILEAGDVAMRSARDNTP